MAALPSPRMSEASQSVVEARPRILVADDQPDVCFALQLLLKGAGYESMVANGPADILRMVETDRPDIVLLDLNYTRDTTSGGEGLELIQKLRVMNPEMPILAMTAWGSVDVAVEAMRRGAVDFVQKPWSSPKLLEKIGELEQLQKRARELRREQQMELEAAQQVQRKLVAVGNSEHAGCQISGSARTARYIGGDFCQVEQLGSHRFAISIADVAGKGVPGALIAASLRAAERPLVAKGTAPATLVSTLNDAMREVLPEDRFVSFFHGVLDLEARKMSYCNAGHNPPMAISTDGSVRSLEAGGAVLGFFPDWQYEEGSIDLHSGDRLLLFTDGIVEAYTEERGEFGADRLQQLALDLRHLPADQMQTGVVARVTEHCGGAFHDDATLVVIAVN